MKLHAALLVLPTVLNPLLAAQDLRGVWKPIEVMMSSGPDTGRHVGDVQPGLLIFTRQHYSTVLVESFTPRTVLPPNPTVDQLLQAWRPFVANAGTYDVSLKDSTVTFRPVVAKTPAVLLGRSLTVQLRLAGDSLWFIERGPNGIERQTKWLRIEPAQ
jgi:hypothetical protein